MKEVGKYVEIDGKPRTLVEPDPPKFEGPVAELIKPCLKKDGDWIKATNSYGSEIYKSEKRSIELGYIWWQFYETI